MGREGWGYRFYWYNLKAEESKHLNTIYGNRKKSLQRAVQRPRQAVCVINFQCLTISKIHSYISLEDKNTFPPELHWGQGSNRKLLTQQFKCVQQMS